MSKSPGQLQGPPHRPQPLHPIGDRGCQPFTQSDLDTLRFGAEALDLSVGERKLAMELLDVVFERVRDILERTNHFL